jgi:hypothetical protein
VRRSAALVVLSLLLATPALGQERQKLSSLDLPSAAQRANIPDAFKRLSRTELLDGWIEVFHAPGLTSPPDTPDKGPEEIPGSGVLTQAPFKIRLSAAQKVWSFDCNTGGSADPACTLADKKRRIEIPGEVLIFPGDGCVYVSRRTNADFDMRRKLCETAKGVLREVKQPSRYVGLKSQTLNELRLFSDRALSKPGVTIPKGSAVEVLIMERDGVYLLRDEFGLTGWIRLPTRPYPGSREDLDIKGFFHVGD